jgi:hypothetical protein
MGNVSYRLCSVPLSSLTYIGICPSRQQRFCSLTPCRENIREFQRGTHFHNSSSSLHSKPFLKGVILTNILLFSSLINTVINYSISLSLGFAGTIETHVNDSGKDLLRGYRGALYLGIGLSGFGIILTMFYGLHEHRRSRKTKVDAASSGE